MKDEADDLNKEIEEQKLREKKNAEKVDITQLSWKDKERVLRVLFAKMNGIVMQSSDGNEENKISASDYTLNDNSQGNPVQQGYGKEEEYTSDSEEDDDEDDSSEYTESEEEEEEGEGKEEYDIHESDIDSVDMIEEMNKQEQEDPLITNLKLQQQKKEEEKEQQESNDKKKDEEKEEDKDKIKTVTPHPPLDEPQKRDVISRNKKRSNSSLSHTSIAANVNNDGNENTNKNSNEGGEGNDDNATKLSSTEVKEGDDVNLKETTEEIMKSDESLEKFIEDGMKDCHKSEEELRAQSKESFDEFLKRSYSKVNEEINEGEAQEVTEANIENATEIEQ